MFHERIRTVAFTLAVFALVLRASLPVDAATITAANCSVAAVQGAVNNAQHGDTVVIPAGKCTWTSGLSVNKGITLTGAGIDKTIIADNVPGDLFALSVSAPNRIVFGNLTIVGTTGYTGYTEWGQHHVNIGGSQTQFRIHHVKFNPTTKHRAIAVFNAFGLIDHVQTTTSIHRQAIFIAHGSAFGGGNYGDKSWAAPADWGGPTAVYVEDSTFVGPSSQVGVIDSERGARVVFRYNNVTDYHVGSHGLDSGQRNRSMRTMEVYRNHFHQTYSRDFFTWCRGGSCVVHNNAITTDSGKSLNQVVKVYSCRTQGGCSGEPYSSTWGMCNGSSPWDGNQSGQSGYRCADQPGSGTSVDLNDASLDTLQAKPVKFQNQLEPIYIWGNTFNGASGNDAGGTSIHVQRNRDVYSDVERPGYTEYTYPHPLAGGAPPATSTAPSAPTSLTVR